MSSPVPLTPFRRAWLRWKSLHLPWRKRFLIGLDLQGNTFWEFRDTVSSTSSRMRRIVSYPRETHYSEIHISPQWHQWLKHVREDAPTIQEQSLDLVRQRNLKVLARQADERWAKKGSFLNQPEGGRERLKVERGVEGAKAEEGKTGEQKVEEGLKKEEVVEKMLVEENQIPVEKDPWKQATRGGPSEEWQPEAWNANMPPARR